MDATLFRLGLDFGPCQSRELEKLEKRKKADPSSPPFCNREIGIPPMIFAPSWPSPRVAQAIPRASRLERTKTMPALAVVTTSAGEGLTSNLEQTTESKAPSLLATLRSKSCASSVVFVSLVTRRSTPLRRKELSNTAGGLTATALYFVLKTISICIASGQPVGKQQYGFRLSAGNFRRHSLIF